MTEDPRTIEGALRWARVSKTVGEDSWMDYYAVRTLADAYKKAKTELAMLAERQGGEK